MAKGSAPTLHLDWSGSDLVITVKGTPASAKATRARARVNKEVLQNEDVEALTDWIDGLLMSSFPFLTALTGAEQWQ